MVAKASRRTWRKLRLPLSLWLLDCVVGVVCHFCTEERAEKGDVGHRPGECRALWRAEDAAGGIHCSKSAIREGLEGADEGWKRWEAHQERDIWVEGGGDAELVVVLRRR